MAVVWTKRANAIFAGTDGGGSPRQVVNSEAQTWGTEVETLIEGFESEGAVGPVPQGDRTAIKALDTDVYTLAFCSEAGREGLFQWAEGDYSAQVTADTREGRYLEADDVASSSGAWVRVGPISHVEASWYGTAADAESFWTYATISAGSASLTISSARSFTAADVGKLIVLPGAGAAGVPLTTTIAAFVSSTQVTLGASAATSLAAAAAYISIGTDDAAAINAAIQGLPVTGGVVKLRGQHAIASAVVIGNGTALAVSTRYGVRIEGDGTIYFKDGAHPVLPASGLTWVGSSGGIMLNVAGSLVGWGVSNLMLDGRSVAAYGIYAVAAAKGHLSDIHVNECNYGIWLTGRASTVDIPSPYTAQVIGENVIVRMPAIANAIGIMFDGDNSGLTPVSTFNCIFHEVWVYPVASVVQYGVVRKMCDNIIIHKLIWLPPSTVAAGSYAVLDDYTGNSIFPSDCAVYEADIGWQTPASQQWAVNGTPSASATPNKIFSLAQINGGVYPTALANVVTDLPQVVWESSVTGQTAGISSSTVYTPTKGGRFRVSWAIRVTTAGAAGTAQVFITYKDAADGVTRSIGGSAVALTSTANSNHGSAVIEASLVSGFIQRSVTLAGVSGTPAYAVSFVIERLN